MNIKIQEKIQKNIQSHLEGLKDSIENYFETAQEKVTDDFMWVQNVSSVNKKPLSFNSAEYEVLIDLTSHSDLKISFQNQGITDFLLNLQEKAKLLLLPSQLHISVMERKRKDLLKTRYRNLTQNQSREANKLLPF